jgi:hypothetical protein
MAFMFIPIVLSCKTEEQKALGDEIICEVNTIEGEGRSNDVMNIFYNKNVENIMMFINRKTGTLTINFDFSCDINSAYAYRKRFLIRMFDKNGQYLTHFVTEEISWPPGNCILLTKKGNHLQYKIDLRDAVYAKRAEFGFMASDFELERN